jgi:hypothetical protein
MNLGNMQQLTSYFRVVSKERHQLNIAMAQVVDSERQQANRSRLLQEESIQNEIRTANRIASIVRRRATTDEARCLQNVIRDSRTAEQIVRDQIDEICEDVIDVQQKKRRICSKRPHNWQVIAEYALSYGNEPAICAFKESFENASNTAIYQRVLLWKKDLATGKLQIHSKRGKMPIYGKEIDDLLLLDFNKRRDAGLNVDDEILRKMLVIHLVRINSDYLLKENGGMYTFGPSWARRFYRRHNISCRVCTTKMRERPRDFEEKKEAYLKIGAELICKYQVPKELVIGCDETSVQFLSRARSTRNLKGAQQVRILGMGDDKAQITTTIFITEA